MDKNKWHVTMSVLSVAKGEACQKNNHHNYYYGEYSSSGIFYYMASQ
ncbi:MAG: hypothetical protein PF505_09180 [Vallitaleaceae bacterium]|jgi:hypothetical protein|nr:hypothetical protein [Vallitaleaceae bacterium]